MLEFLNRYFFGISVPLLLVFAGIYLTFKLKCFYIFHPIKVIKTFFKKQPGSGISPFSAVSTALAGTLGVGNIVGVASALSLGGYGAIFWMWISAVCASVLKYSEIALSVSHRRYRADGSPHGGAMYYIFDYLNAHKKPTFGIFLSGIFAGLCILDSFTMGCIVQINSAANAIHTTLGIDALWIGIGVALFVLFIVLTGKRSIFALNEKLVPFLSLGYILISIIIIIIKKDMLPTAFGLIFKNAFCFDSAMGGFIGFILSRSLRYGTMRGLLSNEAGCGTAPLAHSAANTKSPAEQGFWGIFEVFIDTIILCTMTALVIIVSTDCTPLPNLDGINLTIFSYSQVIGTYAGFFIALSILFFGFATILCWAYYGLECVSFLTNKKAFSYLYIASFLGCIIYGSLIAPENIWGMADFAIGIMTTINVCMLISMRREICEITVNYFNNKVEHP